MESLKKQAAKLLGEQKKYKRWLAVFLCLAVVVTAGTVAALKMNGQALSHKQKVLECKLEVHEHTEECYKADPKTGEKKLVCGLADYVVHVHNDDCYGADGELACQLPEVESHVHEDSCYQEKEVLICGKEENPGHVHTEECRALICGKEAAETAEPETEAAAPAHQHTDACKTLICGKEETPGHQHTEACRTMSQGELKCESTEEGHEHTAECYEQIETITCGQEETEAHVHDDTCYDFSGCGLDETTGDIHAGEGNAAANEGHIHTDKCYNPYACGIEEGAEGHVHTEACYQTKRVAVCGKLELHTHVKPEEAGEGEKSCYDAEGNLVCGIPELKEHVHGEDCFVTAELTKEEVEAMQGSGDGSQEAEGGEAGESKVERTLYQKSFENEFIKIVAEYDETAGIPVDAELFIEQVSGTEMEDIEGVTGTEVTTESLPEAGETASDAAAPEVPENKEGKDTSDKGTDAGNTAGVNTDSGNTSSTGADAGSTTDKERNAGNTSDTGAGAGSTTDVETNAGNASDAKGTLQTTGEDVSTSGQDTMTDEQPETEPAADSSENMIDRALQGRGRMEIVPEEVTYRIGFRLNGEEIEPQGSVTFTVWNLEEEGSEPQTIVCSGKEGNGDSNVTLTRMVEVFVQTEFQKVYEDETIRVIAEYEQSANIPEEAELRVNEITPESDPERFADCEEKFREAVEDEEAEMSTLLDIGFYVDGVEVEPEDTVTMMVQFLDGKGQPIGDPINVVHFAADKTEVLEESTADEDGYVVFKTDSFSPFAFFQVAGATLGVGARDVATGIPLCELLEDGTWRDVVDAYNVPVSMIPNGGWQINENGLCIPTGEFGWKGLSGYDSALNTLNESSNAKWIAYSEIVDGKEQITTGKIVSSTFGLCWAFEGVTNVAQITGKFYYLPGNTEAYRNESLENVAGKKCTVLLHLGNGASKTQNLTQYENAGWMEVKGSVTEMDDPEGSSEKIKVGTVKLPDHNELMQLGKTPERYSFRLAGWYNITDQTYYSVENGPVEAEVNADEENIFYADWIAADYNFHDRALSVKETKSTNDFITTRVFDFNELFNVYSADVEFVKDTSGNVISWQWNLIDGFRTGEWSSKGNGRHLELNEKRGHPLVFVGGGEENNINKPKGWAESIGNNSKLGAAAGIWSENLQDILPMLFSETSNALGVHYIGEGDCLYSYNERTGQYIYDSEFNAASYQKDESGGRFYVYNNPQFIGIGKTAFLPFNGYQELAYGLDAANVNYHFGMCSEINFYLPKTNEDGAKDLVFNFSGDDDVWVFLDGNLVLDMGGIHGRQEGEINFTKKTFSTGSSSGSFVIQDTPYNEHKLTIYYMERGGYESNCKISFNIKPRYLYEKPSAETVTVEKIWKGIEGKDAQPVQVQLYKEYYENGTKKEEVIDTVELNSAKNWKYTWEGLRTLESAERYKVREIEISGYDKSTALKTTGSWDYWVQKPLAEGEILILNVGEGTQNSSDGSVKYAALGHDLRPVEVKVQNGVISPLTISNMAENPRWTAVPCDDNQYKLYYTGEDGVPYYLTYDTAAGATSLKITSNPEEAICFVWNDEVGYGLCKADGDKRRIVYKDGSFKVDGNFQSTPGSNQEDTAHVNVYLLESVSSRVSNYTITNTYQPTITIKKVDRKDVNKELPGAEFKLTRSYTTVDVVDEETETNTHHEYYCYDDVAKGWDWRAYDPENPGENVPPSFQITTGKLRLEEARNGNYVLTEVAAPENYKILPESAKTITFTVENSEIKEVNCGSFEQAGSDETEEKVAEIGQIADKKLLLLVKNEREVYSAKVKLTKNSTSGGNPALGGAKFELYRELSEDEVEDAKNDETLVVLEVDGTKKNVIRVTEGMKEVSDDETGVFFEGTLQTGTYYLKEITPPAGYHILTDIVTLTVDLDKNTSSFTVTKKIGGSAVAAVTEGEYKVVKILNTQGYELPETGSLGTKTFTIGGAMLILSAAAILMYGYSVRRKKSERRLKK